jgi:hypothetical protein
VSAALQGDLCTKLAQVKTSIQKSSLKTVVKKAWLKIIAKNQP